jgi:toxin ParE1/3/4
MAEVILRPDADADLAEILTYSVDHFGRDTGIAYLRGIGEVFDLLEDHPRAGAPRNDIKPGLRSIGYHRHKIFYEVSDETVWILRVLHQSVDVEQRLG